MHKQTDKQDINNQLSLKPSTGTGWVRATSKDLCLGAKHSNSIKTVSLLQITK